MNNLIFSFLLRRLIQPQNNPPSIIKSNNQNLQLKPEIKKAGDKTNNLIP